MKRNKFFGLLSALAATITLGSCSTNLNPDLPTDYSNSVVTVTDADGNTIDVPFNYDRSYYDDIGEINATAVNSILDYIASELTQGQIKDEDGNVMSLYSSEEDEDADSAYELSFISSVDDDHTFQTTTYQYKGVSKEITARIQRSMLDMVTGGTYDYLNVFDERNYALTLNSDALAKIDASKVQNTLDKNVVVNSTTDYEDVFTPDIYDAYINKSQAPSIIENMLTAQYIYNKRYSSIVNADYRDVSIVALTDREDRPGSASELIQAYYNDFISQNKVIDSKYADNPLEELSIIWKGITIQDMVDYLGLTEEEASSLPGIMSAAELQWVEENNLSDDNLMAGIEADVEKIHLDNPLLTDTDLQNEYTGNGAYSVEEGIIRAINSLRKQDVYTEGLKKEDDLSDLPSSVTDQLYAANMDDVITYPAGEGVGHGYITPSSSINGDDSDTITIYDADSDTYYLSMIDPDDVYDASYLGTKSTNEQDPTKRAKAMDVAYAMNSSSTYRTDAVVYWIKNLVGDGKLVVRNESFYDYLDSTYPDLFDDDD